MGKTNVEDEDEENKGEEEEHVEENTLRKV